MTEKSGIYKWTSPSGKTYIGQAVNLHRRYTDFANFSREYTSSNSAIDKARRKYPDISLWKYEVLEYADRDSLNDLEIAYIAEYDTTNSRKGYNSAEGGLGSKGVRWGTPAQIESVKKKRSFKGENNPNYGKHHTQEVRDYISSLNKGRKLTEAQKAKKSKPIIQLTLQGDPIREYKSITAAAEDLHCDKSLIMRVCQGKKKTAKGYKWEYKFTK